jgi:exodeoxyribonuclease VII large subunit
MPTEGFFQTHQRLTAKKTAAGKPAELDPNSAVARAISVAQLTTVIDRAIKAGVPATVYVRGEVSNANLHGSSGHLYFTLKDADACIDCVMFRNDVARLKFRAEDGMELICTGRVGLYASRGRYQLYATAMQPVGQGALELAFRQLQKKLAALGLFDASRKKTIPRYPERIVLVTSQSTAAIADMLKVLRRFSFLRLWLYHVPVQGEGAGAKIAEAIAHLNTVANEPIGKEGRPLNPDLILLARGGGSLEDLWAFNEEAVARAIAASGIPIITGIGHEIDVSIADLAADYHAHTPTEAAQVATEHWKRAADNIDILRIRLRQNIRQMMQTAAQRLAGIQRHEVFRRPLDRVHALQQNLDDRQRALSLAISDRMRAVVAQLARADARLQKFHPRNVVALNRQQLTSMEKRASLAFRASIKSWTLKVDSLDRHLRALSPEAALHRGYSITTIKKTGQIVRDAGALQPGDRILTKFSKGETESIVQDAKQLPLFE